VRLSSKRYGQFRTVLLSCLDASYRANPNWWVSEPSYAEAYGICRGLEIAGCVTAEDEMVAAMTEIERRYAPPQPRDGEEG
jgi:hypothetical protein